MGLFNKKKDTNQSFENTAKGRDVYQYQEQRDIAPKKKPTKTIYYVWSVIAFIASIPAVAFLIASFKLIFGFFASMKQPQSLTDFDVSGNFKDEFLSVFQTPLLLIICIVISFLIAMFVLWRLLLHFNAVNALNDDSVFTSNPDDVVIRSHDDIIKSFHVAPDAGFHYTSAGSSTISHIMASNKGLPKVDVAMRELEDKTTSDGDKIFKGELVYDNDGDVILESKPIFDMDFQKDLFSASGIPQEAKEYRKPFDVASLPYNPKNKEGNRANREKLKYDTIGELIKDDWEFPEYEVQRPAGLYIVDTAPVNTMVLAITRAGKGQTYIEPTIDLWTREKRQNNIVINDPKGELIVKFYVPASVRGYEIVQFNLINSMKTDIYNPLGFAAQSAREGDFTKAASYVENIGDIFFPKDGAEDPMWPNAANNAFKRSCYVLIDIYLEEEKALRRKAIEENMPQKILEQKLDDMWGKVTLYNAYQLFVILSSKKSRDIEKICLDKEKLDTYQNNIKEYRKALAALEAENVEITPEMRQEPPKPKLEPKDFLTLLCDATQQLPRNQMRTLVANADNALRAMAGSDKTIASVYGIALTAMSFFTDPTISTLTSGKPSQNFDAGGLSFPRRIGIRFSPEYREKYKTIGLQAIWTAYRDKNFTDKYEGKDFTHSELVSREGWARFFFDGKFENKKTYLKLELRDPATKTLVKTLYFLFTLGYKTTLDGKSYVKDPILGEKIVHNGVLEELVKDDNGNFTVSESIIKVKRNAEFYKEHSKSEIIDVPVISQTFVRYSEKPKMVFFITPPHLMNYAKLILILIKQMIDVNFESSYLTKESQKPLYKTRYMLDELGNLQSEGHGIPGLQTMLSIGLGQDQQFTLILQTLQQLRDVYGDSVDKVIQGNTSNIIYLKSTDDAMLDTLQKLSGTTHRLVIESSTVTTDVTRQWSKNEGAQSNTRTLKEVPTISFNDMLFIPQNNSMVFRAGDPPVWNRNQTVLPMSWRLLQNTITVPGREYSLQTIPTLSSAMSFDIRKNTPNFYSILDKRVKQARLVPELLEKYKESHELTEHEMEQLDPEILSDEIMTAVQHILEDSGEVTSVEDIEKKDIVRLEKSYEAKSEDNHELLEETAVARKEQDEGDLKRFADGHISRNMLCKYGNPSGAYDDILSRAYEATKQYFMNDPMFNMKDDGSLYDRRSGTLFVEVTTAKNEDFVNEINKAIYSEEARVFAENRMTMEDTGSMYRVTPDFVKWLSEQGSWRNIASGRFDREVARQFIAKEEE